MSGHSKWHKIRHKKGASDAKRGQKFTKLGNAITIAARQGGADPEMNFSLRLAIEKAKAENMPKDNIERAVARGSGDVEGANLEEITYEGYGPAKVAFMLEAVTDNKNRTAAEVKHIFEKHGGSLGGPGTVAWMFEKKGVISIDKKDINESLDEFELKLIDWGADDIEIEDEDLTIYCPATDLQKLKNKLDQEEIKISEASLEMVAKDKIEIATEEENKLEKFIESLEESDDINNYYTNLK